MQQQEQGAQVHGAQVQGAQEQGAQETDAAAGTNVNVLRITWRTLHASPSPSLRGGEWRTFSGLVNIFIIIIQPEHQ